MTATAPVTCVTYAENLPAAAAAAILDHHAGSLPDLTHCTILVPDLQSAPAVRRALLAAAGGRGHGALLGPAIQTLDQWLQTRVPAPRPILTPAAQELVMVEAVRDARHLFNADDPWVVSGELLRLFDELTLARAEPADFPAFERRLARAYGIAAAMPAPFGAEARMVHGLWRAWHEQLDAQGQLDPAQAHVLRLAQSVESIGEDDQLWLIGLTDLAPAEIDWLRALLDSGRARLFWSGAPGGGDNGPGTLLRTLSDRLGQAVTGAVGQRTVVTGFLDAVFDTEAGTLAERAAHFAAAPPADPLTDAIATLAADNAEQERARSLCRCAAGCSKDAIRSPS